VTGKIVGATRSTDGRGGVLSTCLSCGAYIPRSASYCREHEPVKRSTRMRGGGAQISKFRRLTLLLAGTRCEAVVDGERCACDDAADLESHHIVPVAAGGTHDARTNGICLCRWHHAAIEGRKLVS
jgi:hypothetical protein